jgi:hypothetical protein
VSLFKAFSPCSLFGGRCSSTANRQFGQPAGMEIVEAPSLKCPAYNRSGKAELLYLAIGAQVQFAKYIDRSQPKIMADFKFFS